MSKEEQKTAVKICSSRLFALSLHTQTLKGTLADRLGNGLQNRVEQFDSARYLTDKGRKRHAYVLYRFTCTRPSLIPLPTAAGSAATIKKNPETVVATVTTVSGKLSVIPCLGKETEGLSLSQARTAIAEHITNRSP